MRVNNAMPKSGDVTSWFRMRQLPKPEYRLMKGMIAKYHLKDDCELVTVLLRLGYEVTKYNEGQGEEWFIHVIDTLRAYTQEQRVYTLD